jgi:hypothetical protein
LFQPDECARITKNSLHIIHSTGKKLVEDKKAPKNTGLVILRIKIFSVSSVRFPHTSFLDNMLNSLTVKSNVATDPCKRLSDADILDQLSTFLFAG